MVSIDSCLNNVTQNDAWCFSNRLAGYIRRIANTIFRCTHNNNNPHLSLYIPTHILNPIHSATQSHSPHIHRVSFYETLHDIRAIVQNIVSNKHVSRIYTHTHTHTIPTTTKRDCVQYAATILTSWSTKNGEHFLYNTNNCPFSFETREIFTHFKIQKKIQ